MAAGEVGYLVAGVKELNGAPVGDTITLASRPCAESLPGFQEVQPRVFAGLFPIQSEDFEDFRDALKKLQLNDAALQYEPESSAALGFGFRHRRRRIRDARRDRLVNICDRRLYRVLSVIDCQQLIRARATIVRLADARDLRRQVL